MTVAAGDGSIYVVGVLTQAYEINSAQTDCFVLRLDASLNLIYARSFGSVTSVTSLVCSSVQVTRNSDFLYIGGTLGNGLFFSKMSGTTDNIKAQAIYPTTSGETLTMRRIILETGNAFTTSGAATAIGNDNNKLYFCGHTTANGYDFIFGRVLSSNVNVAGSSVTTDIIIQYGSPNYENPSLGDCALTEDLTYFVGVFSTNHQIQRSVSPI